MSTKNTSENLLATDDQIGHIKGFIDQELRGLHRNIAQLFIQNGELVKKAFSETMKELRCKLKAVSNVSKVIRPNTLVLNISDFKHAFFINKIDVDPGIYEYFEKVHPEYNLKIDREIQFVELPVTLIEKEDVTIKEIYLAAARLNLDYCLPKDALHLRLQYNVQPPEIIHIVTKEVNTDDYTVFTVRRRYSSSIPEILIQDYDPNYIVHKSEKFLFRKRPVS